MSVDVRAVIFDLDGTLLDTESVCYTVGQKIAERYGKALTKDIAKAGIGKRPHECWQVIADRLQINVSAEQLVQESEPMLRQCWPDVRALPGAERLVNHLHSHGVPLGLATSTSKESFNLKMRTHAALRDKFTAIVCGDEVTHGKPDPELFLKAAAALGVEPHSCLVIEDAPSGIEAGLAAGMKVVAVPSLGDKDSYKHLACTTLASLLDFRPGEFGLPPLTDFVHGTVILKPCWRIKGAVMKGFGRGSKELGIPTANLAEEALEGRLGDAVSGVYYGWASIGDKRDTHKMVMSVGWNPFYDNDRRTCEPWILEDFEDDFYDLELRLVVCGYIRPEANFSSLEALIERIHEDGRVAKLALDDESCSAYQRDDFLVPEQLVGL